MATQQLEIESILLKELNAARTRFCHAPQIGTAPAPDAGELRRALERFSHFVLEGTIPPDLMRHSAGFPSRAA